ncbi:hypothetical protein LPJ57_001082 [Coemansia sp. RSA 486]|nr:hypothetical protein LPJ57_001082 [Coemansia sp. RSA 486]
MVRVDRQHHSSSSGAATKEHHLSRNGSDPRNPAKKHGAGPFNWGSYSGMIDYIDDAPGSAPVRDNRVQILLTATALAATNRVICGISSDALLEKKRYKEYLDPYRKKELNVLLFLRKIRKDIIVELAPISDPYGPTATDPTIEALVVSRETLTGSDALNVRRRKTGFRPMHLLSVDLITLAENADSSCNGHHSASICVYQIAIRIFRLIIRVTNLCVIVAWPNTIQNAPVQTQSATLLP